MLFVFRTCKWCTTLTRTIDIKTSKQSKNNLRTKCTTQRENTTEMTPKYMSWNGREKVTSPSTLLIIIMIFFNFFYWSPLHKCVNTFTTSGQILPTWMLFVSSFFIAVLFLCWPLEGSVTPVVNNWSASSPFGPCQVASERLSFQVLWPL